MIPMDETGGHVELLVVVLVQWNADLDFVGSELVERRLLGQRADSWAAVVAKSGWVGSAVLVVSHVVAHSTEAHTVVDAVEDNAVDVGVVIDYA